MVVCGEFKEITFNHPTVGSGVFNPKAGEEGKFDLGGIRKEDDNKLVDGGGSAMYKMSRVLGFFEIVITNDQHTKKDYEKAKALAEDPLPAEWTFTGINKIVYGGSGTIVGDLHATTNGVFTIKVVGPEFKQIS
jgi:hypothetical protein